MFLLPFWESDLYLMAKKELYGCPLYRREREVRETYPGGHMG